jgi:hypothetical protein
MIRAIPQRHNFFEIFFHKVVVAVGPVLTFATGAHAFGGNSVLKNDLLKNKCPKCHFHETSLNMTFFVENLSKK